MQDRERTFPTEVIATLSTGIGLCEFGAVHEAAEYLTGHPIWTHHFADKALWAKMQARVLEQHPDMPTEMPGVTEDNYMEKVHELHAKFGPSLVILKGPGTDAPSPFDGIPDGMPVVALVKD